MMEQMKIRMILAVFTIFFISSLQSQTIDVEYFLKKNDMRGLICHCNGNEISAIEELYKYSPADTIGYHQLWYNTYNGLDYPACRSDLKNHGDYCVSLRYKAYYWMLKIFRMEYDIDENEICFFSIWDYKEIKVGENRIFVKNEGFAKDSEEINKRLKSWIEEIKKWDLKNARRLWHPPFYEWEYRIYKPMDVTSFFKNSGKKYECE